MSEATTAADATALAAAAEIDAAVTGIEDRLTAWAAETGTALAALSARVTGGAVDKLIRPVVEELVRRLGDTPPARASWPTLGCWVRNAATSPGGRARSWSMWTPSPTSAPTPSAAT
ncbi:hypothetical protein [Arthrobacter sp. PsM3]|uniref:hypothetical protein n=1 Tax=Arthrobacter sp. PsM3 TaxID=3030531 RepID=UPI00263B7EEA|nr:hypothetical protein [Arthrobacter sp. PsM3]MDN4645340.1 hypothetical protein [Arthrobacter sp. PsM3]